MQPQGIVLEQDRCQHLVGRSYQKHKQGQLSHTGNEWEQIWNECQILYYRGELGASSADDRVTSQKTCFIADFIRSASCSDPEIQSHIRAINIATSQSELASAYQLDEKFHGLYISASQNKKVMEMYRTLNSHAYAAYIIGHETRAQIMDGALEHQKLYDAILSNEKMEVHRLVTLHLENARHNICTILKELELTT